MRGIIDFDEPGVFVAFEESVEDLVANVASLGFDLRQFEADGLLVIDHVGTLEPGLVISRRLGPRGAAAPARRGHRRGRRQADRDRHGRDPLRSVRRHGAPAVRAAAAVRVAQGPRRDRGDHRRARRREPDPPRHRGVRLRLRDRARPPRHRADLDPPAAGAQVPRLGARHQRVPLPDRRLGRVGAAHHLARAAAHACPPSGCPPASPGSTTCSGTAASTGAARCW